MAQTKRYALPLPVSIYDEIQRIAEAQDRSMKDVLQQCLRFGLTALKIADDPNSEIVFKEKIKEKDSDAVTVKESTIKFIW